MPTSRILNASTLLEALENEVSQLAYGKDPVELYEPISYLMSLGGKRLRPVLVLLAAQLFKDIETAMYKPALAVEVFHNFTLMHDDIMDKAPLRRGQPTVHQKWSESVAILSGDVMLVAAYNLLLTIEDHKLRDAIRLFNKVAAEVCEGQQFDMNFEQLPAVSIQDYVNMIRLKTAVLLGFSCRLGGLLADATSADQDLLDEFGTTIGVGFQLMDDILDVYADKAAFGKQVGGDIIANKKTWLLIKALELAPAAGLSDRLNHLLYSGAYSDQDKVAGVKAIYDQLGVRQLAEQEMRSYYDQGLSLLDQLLSASDDAKQALRDFALALMQRSK